MRITAPSLGAVPTQQPTHSTAHPITHPARWLNARTGAPLTCPFPLTSADDHGDPIAVLDRALAHDWKLNATSYSSTTSNARPSDGFWIGWISYDLGSVLEPTVQPRRRSALPLLELHRCEDAWILDPSAGTLSPRGNPPPLLSPLSAAVAPKAPDLQFRSLTGRPGYLARVRRALEYIRAGDIYQVNIAHRLSAPYTGSPRALASSLFNSSDPARGAYIEPAGGASPGVRGIASLSPELFLHYHAATRTLTTRPMKGTRRVGPGAEAELRGSAKEQAELHMITDLMRNDLGRVCALGSVRVEDERLIEPHAAGALLQASARVSGRLRNDLTLARALGLAFPAGSITGTPKIRAMQIIDQLEDFPRGPWCGCIAVFEDNGDAHLSVTIRTALIHAATVDYPVGAGIVADSTPEAEWTETLDKASILLGVGTIKDQP